MTEEVIKKVPALYLFVNNKLESLTPNRANLSIARAMAFFNSVVEEQRKNEKKESGALYRDSMIEAFSNWASNFNNTSVYVKYCSAKTRDEIISSLIVKDLVYVADTVEEDDYNFTVENREVAQLLIQNNDGYSVIGEHKDGRVELTRPETIVGIAFVKNNNNVELKTILEENLV